MTDFKELFKHARYGSYSESYEKVFRVHIVDPETILETKRIKMYDDWAADHIKDLENTLTILKDYRQVLASRYSEMQTAATIPVIRLRRQRDYWKDHKVFYYLEEIQRYIDQPNLKEGTAYTDNVINSIKYAGSERRDAIKAFNDYKKAHPGIEAILDIEKSKWER